MQGHREGLDWAANGWFWLLNCMKWIRGTGESGDESRGDCTGEESVRWSSMGYGRDGKQIGWAHRAHWWVQCEEDAKSLAFLAKNLECTLATSSSHRPLPLCRRHWWLHCGHLFPESSHFLSLAAFIPVLPAFPLLRWPLHPFQMCIPRHTCVGSRNSRKLVLLFHEVLHRLNSGFQVGLASTFVCWWGVVLTSMAVETTWYLWEMLLRDDGEREVCGLEVRGTSRKCKALAFPLKQNGCYNSVEERNVTLWRLRQHDFEVSLCTLWLPGWPGLQTKILPQNTNYFYLFPVPGETFSISCVKCAKSLDKAIAGSLDNCHVFEWHITSQTQVITHC